MKKYLGFVIIVIGVLSCQHTLNKNASDLADLSNVKSDSITYLSPKAIKLPIINGSDDDTCWGIASWDTLDQFWLGNACPSDDFNGRYKAVWYGNQLYFYLEIEDDSILNIYEPLIQYWDDDCVEIFIDENASGGNHQYNHQAFAYHIAPNMDAIDIGTDQKAHFYNSHIHGKMQKVENTYCWELALTIYSDSYSDNNTTNLTVELFSGKELGFSIAYCDNDTSKTRENFIGSVNTTGHYRNDGWIDASCFGKMVLTD